MRKKRQTFSKEFKLEAVRLLERSNRTPNEIAIDLGVRRNQLYKWQEQLNSQGDNAFRGSGRKPVDQSDELTRLRKELEKVTEECDILKKAAVHSTEQCNTYTELLICMRTVYETYIYSRRERLSF